LLIEVQVYLRAGGAPKLVEPLPPGERPTREDLASERAAALEKPFRIVEHFAAAYGLSVVDREPARRMIVLSGTVAAFTAAMGVQLDEYSGDGRRFRARSGPLFASRAAARVIESVLGFGTRPVARAALGPLAAAAGGGRLPNAYAGLYDFPATPGRGAGQKIALIQFGGEYVASDTIEAFAAMGIAVPTVTTVSRPGAVALADSHLDREIALDVQVAGAVAPNAELVLIFGALGNGGFVDALSHAVHDPGGAHIISVSYGVVEEEWDADALKTFRSVLADAATLGITVIAATGDLLATSGYDGEAHVSYPASDPHVLACGGTTLRTDAAGGLSEAVWNDGVSGTGGGISTCCERPAYQAKLTIPHHATGNAKGRGLPDVSAIADRSVGYRIRCHGAWVVEGGTSAVAPLWAGLIALVNEGKGRTIGFANPALYGAAQAFNDVILGDNKADGIGYAATSGWDPCTGLGSPRGQRLYELL
jgi:kumamolisin